MSLGACTGLGRGRGGPAPPACTPPPFATSACIRKLLCWRPQPPSVCADHRLPCRLLPGNRPRPWSRFRRLALSPGVRPPCAAAPGFRMCTRAPGWQRLLPTLCRMWLQTEDKSLVLLERLWRGGAPSTAGVRGDPLPLPLRQWEKATDLRMDLTGPTSSLAPLRPAPAGDHLPCDLGCDSQPRGLLGPAGAALNSGLDSEPDVVRERVSESAVRLRTRPELKAVVTL